MFLFIAAHISDMGRAARRRKTGNSYFFLVYGLTSLTRVYLWLSWHRLTVTLTVTIHNHVLQRMNERTDEQRCAPSGQSVDGRPEGGQPHAMDGHVHGSGGARGPRRTTRHPHRGGCQSHAALGTIISTFDARVLVGVMVMVLDTASGSFHVARLQLKEGLVGIVRRLCRGLAGNV